MKQQIPQIPGLTSTPPLVFWASGAHPMDNHIALLPRDIFTLTSSQNELLKVTDNIYLCGDEAEILFKDQAGCTIFHLVRKVIPPCY